MNCKPFHFYLIKLAFTQSQEKLELIQLCNSVSRPVDKNIIQYTSVSLVTTLASSGLPQLALSMLLVNCFYLCT